MSIETMTKISTITVGSGGSASIEFTNIPQTYTDLLIRYSTRGSNADVYTSGVLTFNNSTTGYSSIWIQGSGSSAVGGSYSGSSIAGWNATGTSATASTFGNGEFFISNYTESRDKQISHHDAIETNAATTYMEYNVGTWQNTSAITTVTLALAAGATFAQYSSATLYGIKNAAKAIGNSLKATGGDINFDGTYVVHTFKSSGTFTTLKPLTIDSYLVVGGGGAGGGGYGYENGGGGGAGAQGLAYRPVSWVGDDALAEFEEGLVHLRPQAGHGARAGGKRRLTPRVEGRPGVGRADQAGAVHQQPQQAEVWVEVPLEDGFQIELEVLQPGERRVRGEEAQGVPVRDHAVGGEVPPVQELLHGGVRADLACAAGRGCR